jgi:hypothetical protein
MTGYIVIGTLGVLCKTSEDVDDDWIDSQLAQISALAFSPEA